MEDVPQCLGFRYSFGYRVLVGAAPDLLAHEGAVIVKYDVHR